MKKTVNKLTLIYYCIYIIAIVGAGMGYSLHKGQNLLTVEQSQNEIAITSVYILLLIAAIPLALKMFNTKVKKLSEVENFDEKVIKYTQYSIYRLLVMAVCLLLGIFLFYTFNSKSMLFCAGIAAIALVFCKPSEVKMANELDVDDETEEE